MNGTGAEGIPGLPAEASQALVQRLAQHPGVEQIWLYGSRAMNRHRSGSDIDLCLEGPALGHRDLLQLMEAHLQRVGRPLLPGPTTPPGPSS